MRRERGREGSRLADRLIEEGNKIVLLTGDEHGTFVRYVMVDGAPQAERVCESALERRIRIARSQERPKPRCRVVIEVVGTQQADVDGGGCIAANKFQGQQAPVVMFSMATSSAFEMPRTADFLFSRNRLNVAISRARCLAYVVCTDQLLDSRARTVEDMQLISTLCAFAEYAG